MKIWQIGLLIQIAAFLLPSSAVAETVSTTVGLGNTQIVAITSAAYDPGDVSRNTLRAIFLMRYAKWDDGTPVKVYVFSDTDPNHETFTKEILRFLPRQLRQAWDRQVFSGLGQYPEQVVSVQEMLRKVKSTPGSVGYLSMQEVTKDVRILQIRP
jgi:ABC-type phosphate transport system substrate-binding protein